MQITLYVRTYPVADAPIVMSFFPDPPEQNHTYTRDGAVYAPTRHEIRVRVPDGSMIDPIRRVLRWPCAKGSVSSTVSEVYGFVQARARGFGACAATV